MQSNKSRTNFFNLDKPDEWHCQLWSYQAGHSHMEVAIYNLTEKYYRVLSFIDVAYCECPNSWKGANFQIFGDDECLAILRRTTRYDRITDQSLLEDFRLFSVEILDSRSEKLYVKIIAAPVSHISDDTYQIPP